MRNRFSLSSTLKTATRCVAYINKAYPSFYYQWLRLLDISRDGKNTTTFVRLLVQSIGVFKFTWAWSIVAYGSQRALCKNSLKVSLKRKRMHMDCTSIRKQRNGGLDTSDLLYNRTDVANETKRKISRTGEPCLMEIIGTYITRACTNIRGRPKLEKK